MLTALAVKPALATEPLATLDWGGGVWGGSRSPDVRAIDGEPVPSRFFGSSTKVAAGEHKVDFDYSVYRGPFAIPGHAYVARSLTFEALAGHVYRLRTECVAIGSGNCSSWIEDTSTRVAVAGILPAWYDRDLAARSEVTRRARAAVERFDQLIASACGDAETEFDVALYYLAGIAPVGEIDLASAYAWYALAEADGHPEAALVRRNVEAELSREQLAFAEEATTELRQAICAAAPGSESDDSVPGAAPDQDPS